MQLPKREMFLLFRRVNAAAKGPVAKRRVSKKQFEDFFDLMDGEIAQVARAVRRELRRAVRRGVRLREEFKRLDVEGNGDLTAREFGRALRGAGVSLSREDEKQLLRRLDSDGSDTVNWREFLRFARESGQSDRRQQLGAVRRAREVFRGYCRTCFYELLMPRPTYGDPSAWG